ncbi:SH3 domain-containing protein [Luteimicrobium album]|uniref:SH3 domain-containing protein n=1 Tax=Luteimicrobium album TaxID=1054550 RepID=UPI0024E04E4B|nr:SH3 domain-containing protein [Luteimicrobium album]
MTFTVAAALAFAGVGATAAGAATPGTATIEPAVLAAALEAATPTNTTKVVTPLKSGKYRLSSYYGPRCMPTVDASDWHLGQDLAAADGTPIYAVANGVVRKAGAVSGFGQWIVIDHVIAGKKVSTVYGHMWNATKYVKAGQTVKAGQHIADVGSNGVATGPHLHLEVWPGGYGVSSTDPLPYMKAHGVNLTAGATSAIKRTVPSSCTYYARTRLNLRVGASTGTPSEVVLPVNATLTTKPGSKSNGWLPVKYGTRSGWVDSSYVGPSKVAVPAPSKPVRYVAVTTLNLRASASTSSKVVAKLKRGAAVTYQGSVSKSGWVKVTSGGHTGYVATEYLKATKAQALYALKYVNVTTLNLRASASTSSKVVAKLKKNTAVQPQAAASKGWQKVSASGHTGYVATEYLRTTK